VLGQLAGTVALGCGTMVKKAVVLIGPTAQNGKSQVLDLLRGLLPASAISTIPPGKFGDEHHLVGLIGKLLNASDELGTAQAITPDAFKAVVTGEPIRGADKYKPAVDFRPKAQHVFACNRLPNFQSGMDRGVMRRLVLVQFDRTILEDERIADIGQRIAREEADLLLKMGSRGSDPASGARMFRGTGKLARGAGGMGLWLRSGAGVHGGLRAASSHSGWREAASGI
jgi:phage/plasmid-associated DNA primase